MRRRGCARAALRAEPEEAVPEVDTTAVEARSRALAASKLSVAAVVAARCAPPSPAAPRRDSWPARASWRPRRSPPRPLPRSPTATRRGRCGPRSPRPTPAVYAACRAAGGLTRGVLVATHAYALLVAAWPFDGPAAAWSESTRPELDRQWAAIALALAGGAGYWLYANATPLVLALAPWAVVGAARRAARAKGARARRSASPRASTRPAPSRSWRCGRRRDDGRARPCAVRHARDVRTGLREGLICGPTPPVPVALQRVGCCLVASGAHPGMQRGVWPATHAAASTARRQAEPGAERVLKLRRRASNASGQRRSTGVTPQTNRNAVTPGAAVDDRAQPQCGAPRKDRITHPYVTCSSVALSDGRPMALRSGFSNASNGSTSCTGALVARKGTRPPAPSAPAKGGGNKTSCSESRRMLWIDLYRVCLEMQNSLLLDRCDRVVAA